MQDPQARTEALAKAFDEFSNLEEDGEEAHYFPDQTDTVLHCANYSTPKTLRIRQCLCVTKAMGLDNIPNVMFKSYSPELAGPCSSVFWLCFHSGTFPQT